jgi:hypothetical protein
MAYRRLALDMTNVLRTPLILALMLTALTFVYGQQTGSMAIEFQVVDFATAQPLQNASVSLLGQQPLNGTTNANGTTALTIPFGTYTLTISKASCTQLGPQPFIVDQTALANILVKLQCQQTSAQPQENPSVRTDRAEYHYNDTITWNASGFAPGAYLQACISTICGGVVQGDRFGNATGIFVIDINMIAGPQTLIIQNIITGTSTQTQITLSA